MKQTSSLQTLAMLTITAAATTFLIQACGGSAEAQSTASAVDANVIEGAWEFTTPIKDCTSGAVLRTDSRAGARNRRRNAAAELRIRSGQAALPASQLTPKA